jgi:hypothetical protein
LTIHPATGFGVERAFSHERILDAYGAQKVSLEADALADKLALTAECEFTDQESEHLTHEQRLGFQARLREAVYEAAVQMLSDARGEVREMVE